MAKPHVLVQVGHDEPHQPGHEGETGAAGELELVRKIGRALMRLLNADDRLEAERIPGLPPSSRKSKRFADVLGREFATFHISEARRNNGTSNLTGYYGWDLLPGSPAACVVEHGFLSNARERAWMHEHVQELADGEYRAILAQLGLETATLRHGRPLVLTTMRGGPGSSSGRCGRSGEVSTRSSALATGQCDPSQPRRRCRDGRTASCASCRSRLGPRRRRRSRANRRA
jgi:hypothetical protein